MQQSKFKLGDTVYSSLKGEGKVIGIFEPQDTTYPINVTFKNGHGQTYMIDGKAHEDDLYPEIYLSKPEIIVPKVKVKREVKRWLPNAYIKDLLNIGFTEKEFNTRSDINRDGYSEAIFIHQEEIEG